MRRVCVIGPSGAGKTTFATRLAEILHLPLIHMDRLNWKRGWVHVTREELIRQLAPILATERWIIDGNYGSTMLLRFEQADTVIFLDYPPRIYRWRVIKRILTGYGRTRPDMTPGCRERLSPRFLLYAWQFHRDNRPNVLSRLESLRPDQRLITLRHPREATRLLDSLRRSAPGTDEAALGLKNETCCER